MSYYTLNISTIQDLKNLGIAEGNRSLYDISNALLNSTGTTVPTQFWYPISTPTSSLYTIGFTAGIANPTNFRLWANASTNTTLPSTISLYTGDILAAFDSNPLWETYYLNQNSNTPYGYTYENAIGNGNLSNISSYFLNYNYNDLGSNDPSTFAVRMYNIKLTGYLPPPPPPPPPAPPVYVPTPCGCGPKPTGPGAMPESMLLAKRLQNCTVTTAAMAQQLVNSQLRGVPSSVRTQKVQQQTLECYAPITDPLRRQALYQGPVITPPCPPTPAEQLNSTRPKVSEASCLPGVPFYQRPPQ
jgi:hypothetical protein